MNRTVIIRYIFGGKKMGFDIEGILHPHPHRTNVYKRSTYRRHQHGRTGKVLQEAHSALQKDGRQVQAHEFHKNREKKKKNADSRVKIKKSQDPSYEIDITNGNSPFIFTITAHENEKYEDKVAHFMFRLAFCKTEEQRLWYLKYETDLFLQRIKRQSKGSIDANKTRDAIVAFLNRNGRNLEKVIVKRETPEWEYYTACLKEGVKGFKEIIFYATDFECVCSLLPARKYYLRSGKLYIPEDELPATIQVIFKEQLTKALNYALSKEAEAAADPRIAKLLGKIRAWQSTHGYASWKGKIDGKVNVAELDSLAKRFYPPCAKVLHNGLKANSHLKHDGRMQYGLFLKGIGLTLEESITFWRTEFTRKISTEVFQKKYMYNIRHNYGTEGKRADYTPWSCTKILNLPPPGEGQYHGCPFKTFSSENLYSLLRQYKIPEKDMEIILKAKASFQYELACLKLFEAINPNVGNAGSSPHAFFIETYNYQRQKQKDYAKDKSKTNDIEDMMAQLTYCNFLYKLYALIFICILNLINQTISCILTLGMESLQEMHILSALLFFPYCFDRTPSLLLLHFQPLF
eukprot:TRINITY_DN88042_c2_g1_i1.p1 TRINITY_DN88042_c2_g1~~TRINITY_DN88042_c2_g1_i1.p1  ORF type:complete len:597 (-),score=58.27 TRINITY_DN88042_c2_g1_i1:5301-7025(-)